MSIVEGFIQNPNFTVPAFEELLSTATDLKSRLLLQKEAMRLRKEHYGNKIYMRGLIEFTNYCKNNCLYCGLRCENRRIDRYRLSPAEIQTCCDKGYQLGFRTFVLQGGEDPYFTDERMVAIIQSIKACYPDCAVTLSIGERSPESYEKLREAGADRYLLRHETADEEHYRLLHPTSMSLGDRKQCLWQLKERDYQVGAGFMVGSPGQTATCLAKDLFFLRELAPQMVGIGPFLPQQDTPFWAEPAGSVERTLFLLSVIRILLPKVLLPATTALGTATEDGIERGLLAGANVIMPNLSPGRVRGKYAIYDHKTDTGGEVAEKVKRLQQTFARLGFSLTGERGDAKQ